MQCQKSLSPNQFAKIEAFCFENLTPLLGRKNHFQLNSNLKIEFKSELSFKIKSELILQKLGKSGKIHLTASNRIQWITALVCSIGISTILFAIYRNYAVLTIGIGVGIITYFVLNAQLQKSLDRVFDEFIQNTSLIKPTPLDHRNS